MANQLNAQLREETLSAFILAGDTGAVGEWFSTRALADRLNIGPQAAYGRLSRLSKMGWLRVRKRPVVAGRRSRRTQGVDMRGVDVATTRMMSPRQFAVWIRQGRPAQVNRAAYVMEWSLTQKSRRALSSRIVAGVAVLPAAPPKPVEIEEVFYRQRRNLGQTEK